MCNETQRVVLFYIIIEICSSGNQQAISKAKDEMSPVKNHRSMHLMGRTILRNDRTGKYANFSSAASDQNIVEVLRKRSSTCTKNFFLLNYFSVTFNRHIPQWPLARRLTPCL